MQRFSRSFESSGFTLFTVTMLSVLALMIFALPAEAADPTCETGILRDNVCCAASCGECAGAGCGSRPGGAASCCGGAILNSGRACHVYDPPCVITQPDPTCETGILRDNVCCAASCGECAGPGCGGRPGGAASCCGGGVLEADNSCDDFGPPCVVATPEPTGGFSFQFSGKWCCGYPPIEGTEGYTAVIVFDNGSTTSANQTYDPRTDFVSLTITAGSYSATLLAENTTFAGTQASYQTDANGVFSAGDFLFIGGTDNLGGSADVKLDLDVTDNDPDLWDSNGGWHRFSWTQLPKVNE